MRRQAIITGNVPTPALLSQLTPALRQTLQLVMPTTFTATSNPLIGFHRRDDNASNQEHTYLTRVDWLVSSRQRLAVRDSYNNQTYSTPNLQPNFPTAFPLRFNNAVVEHTFNIGAATLNELRVGFNRVDQYRQPVGYEQVPAYVSVQGISASFANFIHFVSTTYSVSDNFTMVRGRHSIKRGLDEREVRSVRYQGGPPSYSYNTTADIINQNPASVGLSFTTSKGLRTINMGYYIQDEWRVMPKLQINAGMRYEYSPPLRGGFNVASSNPYGGYNGAQKPMFAADRNDFGPRLGLVWTPVERTVIRVGGSLGAANTAGAAVYAGDRAAAGAPFLALLSVAGSLNLAILALLLFGLGRGAYDCNSMPVLRDVGGNRGRRRGMDC